MKTLKLLFFLFFLLGFRLLSFGQTLEKTYSTLAGYTEEPPNYAFFANSEMHYFTLSIDKNSNTNFIKFYNSSHQELKSTSISVNDVLDLEDIELLSDKLFNSDSKIEFIALIWVDNERYNYKLYNEDGDELFDFGNGFNHKLYKDHNNNYKLLVSDFDNGEQTYRVYGLSGTLSSAQEDILLSKVNTFPNPSSGIINITNLKTNNGVVDVFTLNGQKVLSNKINKSLGNVSLDISSLSAGVYFYKIGSTSRKFIKK